MSEQEQKVQQLVELTQVPANVARALLERNNYNVETALDDFYQGPTAREDGTSGKGREGGAPQPTSRPTSAAGARNKTSAASKFKSFQELVNGEEKDDDDEQNFFAGGGRGSGLEVENPNNPQNLVQDLLKKAESGGGHPDRANESEDAPSAPSFTGVGYRLGDSNSPSAPIGSTSHVPKRAEKAVREITFWKDGFQVGEGPLYRYDDPANATYLAELNAGRAPLSLLNVQYGQDVDVNVRKNLDEEYKPPKRKLGGFHGSGHRLGSPVSPDYVSPSSTPAPSTKAEAKEELKEDKPVETGDATVQVRLVDGRRVIKKLNSTDPVEKLYLYVKSETADQTKPFTLSHAFPVKPIEDLKQSIKDAGLINSVVVQRWV